ncbi:tagaturonate reductase [Plebeiibacterium sediminum]|uniref:Tagaturonate reductase n=1 Tax=Plebeiibacterium sediminum TaxID=2992112 RepID=A0AAE3M1B4_9BACT|nr:tagaturonate reductase [Plebeiobacterium sediminum]MCW3785299.1 tagaturonate reductase [Plebeiobacterium sediminum]
MKALNNETVQARKTYPVKILQFGEGNFLRAFVDWMIQQANNKIDYNAGVVIVQPLANGLVEMLKKQDCMYHVSLQGIKDGKPVEETELIECVMDAVNPYAEYAKYEEYFLSEDLEIVISNTTEAGISRIDDEDINALPPKSYPGKMTALLYKRYKKYAGAADKGLSVICCELIDKNADILKEIVLELAEQNNLEADFINWLNSACTFSSTLVDRIVPGFPKDNIKEIQAELGYEDNLVVVGEYFHLWAIEAGENVRSKFPMDSAGLNVVWLDDMKAFRDKKVRVLNGSHTALVPVGLLCGHETVKEAFDDETVSTYIKSMVAEEVLPNIEGDKEKLVAFADEILERFFNPYIRHFLKDISLNSLSKWVTRDFPTVKDTVASTGKLPKKVTFSLAALLVLYKPGNPIGFEAKDTPELLEIINSVWASDSSVEEKVQSILSNDKIWGINLDEVPGFSAAVAGYVNNILDNSIQSALAEILK